jgi:hypothetical protein
VIVAIPQVEVPDLWTLDADDTKEMPGRYIERASLARGYDHLADLGHACTRVVVEGCIVGRQLIDRIDDDGFLCATLVGVYRRLQLGKARHGRLG